MARVLVLGGGTPTPTAERFGSCHVLEVGDELIMFDCGPATTHKLVKAGLSPTDVNHLFFSHHHYDHDVDYPCFLLTRWVVGAGHEPELRVRGPAPTERFTHRLLDEHEGAFAHDWIARINDPNSIKLYIDRGGVMPRTPPMAKVDAKDVAPGKVYTGKDWEVTAAVAEHAQPWLDCLSYRLDSSEGSFVFTGDTRACQSVVDLARGADVMLCMCADSQERIDLTGLNKKNSGHLDAARMAQEAGVKKLALVHLGPAICHHGEMERVIAATKSVFDGELIFTEEMMWFPV